MLVRLSAPAPGFSPDWRAPGVHVDDSPDVVDDFGNLELIQPILVLVEKEEPSAKSSDRSVPGF